MNKRTTQWWGLGASLGMVWVVGCAPHSSVIGMDESGGAGGAALPDNVGATSAIAGSGGSGGVEVRPLTGGGTGPQSGGRGGTGGTNVPFGGGTSGSGGAIPVLGGAGGTAPLCSGQGGGELTPMDVLTESVLSTGWISSDPGDTRERAYPILGPIRQYGDGSSCVVSSDNPCSSRGCCVHYSLTGNAAQWGCGISVDLNNLGVGAPGEAEVALPYTGSASGLRVTYSNSTSAPVRISYAQDLSAPPQAAPYVEGQCTNGVLFTSVSCPPNAADGCTGGGPHPYRLQVQVVGGNGPAEGELCLTRLQYMGDNG